MKKLLLIAFLIASMVGKAQDKIGIGNVPDGVDSVGIGSNTVWVKQTTPQTGVFTMTTTSTSSSWYPVSVGNSGSTLHWSVTGAVNYEVDANKPTFNFSKKPGIKYITVTSSDNLVGVYNFTCYSRNITEVNVSGLINLKTLNLQYNLFSYINIYGLNLLSDIYLNNCYLSTSSINTMLDDLIEQGRTELQGHFVVSAQNGGGCGDTAKIAALDAAWEVVTVDPCP